MKLNSIHHVAIICSDLDKSKKFYIDILGFRLMSQIYREAIDSYKLDLELSGKYQIELFSFPNPPHRLSFPEACGLRHLAFEVDDINEAHDYLFTCGVSVQNIRLDEYTNKKFFFCTDPDNLPIEIYEK